MAKGEERWNVNMFKVFWVAGYQTLEPIDYLDKVHRLYLDTTNRLQPKIIIVSCDWVRKETNSSFSAWIPKALMFSKLDPQHFPLLRRNFQNQTL
jgi:hypothetical protein